MRVTKILGVNFALKSIQKKLFESQLRRQCVNQLYEKMQVHRTL